MARRTKQVPIIADEDGENRDRGKVFLLTEMSARDAEDWGGRALLALTNAGTEIPDGFEIGGMSAVAALGVQALSGLRYEDVKPLWDQMFECVRIIPDPRQPQIVRDLVDDDIEEVSTRLFLRKEIVGLHVNFSKLASLSASLQAQAAEVDSLGAGVITRTSRGH